MLTNYKSKDQTHDDIVGADVSVTDPGDVGLVGVEVGIVLYWDLSLFRAGLLVLLSETLKYIFS